MAHVGLRPQTIALAVVVAALVAIAVLLFRPLVADAISDDYCGYAIYAANSCYQGGGYQGWDYNQASHPGGATTLCAYDWTGSYYRAGSGCADGVTLFANCSMLGSP